MLIYACICFTAFAQKIAGIKVSYVGYYYSNSKGTIQFLLNTSQNLFDEYKSNCEEFLNGIVELK
jgi:hypothetical protein